MVSIQRQQKAQVIGLDPKFLLLISGVWAVIKFIFKCFKSVFSLIYFLILKAQGRKPKLKPTEVVKPTREVPVFESSVKAPAKEDSFMNYGGIRWFSQYAPSSLKASNLKLFPKGTAITFKVVGQKGIQDFDISLFGDLYEDQIQNVERSIDKIIEELKPSVITLKEVHILKELGKYLDTSGIPDRDIIGFSMDEEGTVLIHEEAALDPNLCYRFLHAIVREEMNTQSAIGKARDTLWNQASSIKERLIHHREYQETDNRNKYGSFRGKAIIDLDAPISEGVYLGAPAREAIYVNRDSDLLNQVYKNMLVDIRKIKEALGLGFEEKVLNIAMKTVQKCFAHNSQIAVNRLRLTHKIVTDEEMPLDFFVMQETGDAEHASLLLAFLLEKLHREQINFLGGKVSIDRNWIPGGGHAWVRYVNGGNNIYIIDCLKGYLGRLDNYSGERWAYERKEDYSRARIARPL